MRKVLNWLNSQHSLYEFSDEVKISDEVVSGQDVQRVQALRGWFRLCPVKLFKCCNYVNSTVDPDLNHPCDEFSRSAAAMWLEAAMALDNVRPAITVGGLSNLHTPWLTLTLLGLGNFTVLYTLLALEISFISLVVAWLRPNHLYGSQVQFSRTGFLRISFQFKPRRTPWSETDTTRSQLRRRTMYHSRHKGF